MAAVAFLLGCHHTPAEMRGRSVRLDPAQTIVSIVTALSAKHPFSTTRLIELTGTKLAPNSDLSSEYFLVSQSTSASPPQPPLTRVQLRMPTAASDQKDGMILLEISPDSKITLEPIFKAFGQPEDISAPTPREPPETPVYYIYHKDWGDLRFGFSRTKPPALTAVILDATAK